MRADRRNFLRVLGLGGAAALAIPGVAWADRIRILGGGASPNQAFLVGRVSPDFQRFARGVRVGQASGHGGLLVFWLYGEGGAPLPVATLEEARSRGELVITERDQATVPELVVDNRGKAYVLLLAGEILLGGKQNRVLSEDTLLPPFNGPRNIGVYCVEQGRWAGRGKDFETRGSFAVPGLRSRLMEKADQGKVWAEVDRYARAAQAPSPTRNYQEVYEKPEVREYLKDMEGGTTHRVAPGALGAAVFVGRNLAGLDLFFDSGLFAREWPKLLRAHALEAYGRPEPTEGLEPNLRERLQHVLASAARVEGVLRGNAGVGQLFAFRLEGARGSALVFEGPTVHAAIL